MERPTNDVLKTISDVLTYRTKHAAHPKWPELLALWAQAGDLYSTLVQGVKQELHTHDNDHKPGKKRPLLKTDFSTYTIALAPVLAGAEELARKRLDATIRLQHLDIQLGCRSLLRHGNALFVRKSNEIMDGQLRQVKTAQAELQRQKLKRLRAQVCAVFGWRHTLSALAFLMFSD